MKGTGKRIRVRQDPIGTEYSREFGGTAWLVEAWVPRPEGFIGGYWSIRWFCPTWSEAMYRADRLAS